MGEQSKWSTEGRTASGGALLADLEQALGACDPRVRRWWEDVLFHLRASAPTAYGWMGGEIAGPLPASYADAASSVSAAADLAELYRLSRDPDRDTGVSVQPSLDGTPWRVVLQRRGDPAPLDRATAALAGLGLAPKTHSAHRILVGGTQWWVDDYRVVPPGDVAPDDADLPTRAARALGAVLTGSCDADHLNRLVLSAGLGWADVLVLRAYAHCRAQLGGEGADVGLITETLVRHAPAARALVEIFRRRFVPDDAAERSDPEAAFEATLDGVVRLDDDRVLRTFRSLIGATVRTNRYVDGFAASATLALKLAGGSLQAVTDDVAATETFVFGPAVEGVHLRAGPVARGGIRWSERSDFRAEIFRLMRAQVLKNATIAPTGAKGGFRLRELGPSADRQEAVADAYEAFITALLDVTDNVEDGVVVPAPGVRRHDGDDPYLVVAADKGTATLSDVANELAAARGFWLGDGFASGGSNGFDHKELGVTARGAWAAAVEHLGRLGLDPAVDPVRFVGVGDMSGDVFGNFLVRSDSIKLVAAFDHRHVFVDPDPDPARSFAERQRLAAVAGSSWADYDPDVLSPGGGVWPRDAKSVTLGAPAREALGLDIVTLTGPELVRAVLRAPVDVLFMGGIGTYVKAAHEDDLAAGDPANRAVRVDADSLRARVAVEGANLGLTQAARVEYAGNGGAVNIDALDNAAGVGTSDREVNLKIVLDAAVRAGELPAGDRDRAIRDAADEVVETVVRDVREKAELVTRETERGAARVAGHRLLLDLLASPDADPRLVRRREVLPDEAELDRRVAEGRGLSRPELAVLASYAATNLSRMLASAAPHRDPLWQGDICAYLPAEAADRFCSFLRGGNIRPEVAAALGAAVVTNAAIADLGIAFCHDLAAEYDTTPVAVLESYGTARRVLEGHRHGPPAARRSRDRLARLTRDYLTWRVLGQWSDDLPATHHTAARAIADRMSAAGEDAGPLDPLGLTARILAAVPASVTPAAVVTTLQAVADGAIGRLAVRIDRLTAPDRVTEVHRRVLLDELRSRAVEVAVTAVEDGGSGDLAVPARFRFEDDLADDPMHRLHQLAIAVSALQRGPVGGAGR